MQVRARAQDAAQLQPSRMEQTPEGYLLCKDVVLARTGTQAYGHWEVPREIRDCREPGGRYVVVHRDAADVFSPATIESFRGRPFTDDHPADDVGPSNYRQLLKGVVQNPRRGRGQHSDKLLGDILIYDAATIAKVRGGKREVSCGYDADYHVVDGVPYQRAITGNHVSLVDAGRCGPECAIRDGAPRRRINGMAFNRDSFLEKLRGVFTKDSPDEREAAMAALEKELPDADDDDEDGEGDGSSVGQGHNHHHVTVNIGGSVQGEDEGKGKPMQDRRAGGRGRDARGRDEDGVGAGDGAMPDMDQLATVIAAAAEQAVKAAVAPLMERLDTLESALEDVSDPDDTMTQDSVARAEVLKPGIKLPVLDSKPGSKAHRDAILRLQRTALAEAFATADGAAAILPLVATSRPNFNTMPPGELGVVFRGASAAMASINDRAAVPQERTIVLDGAGKRGPLTHDSWNSANRAYWDKQAKRA